MILSGIKFSMDWYGAMALMIRLMYQRKWNALNFFLLSFWALFMKFTFFTFSYIDNYNKLWIWKQRQIYQCKELKTDSNWAPPLTGTSFMFYLTKFFTSSSFTYFVSIWKPIYFSLKLFFYPPTLFFTFSSCSYAMI